MTSDFFGTRRVLAACATAFVLTVAAPAFKPVTLRASGALYTVTDLGALNCCYEWVYASAALGINAHGDVAGFTSSPTDPSRTIPFVYQNGTMTAISDNYGWATSINDSGEVTGFVLLPGQPNVHAFRYYNGVFTDIGALPGFSNEPFSIGWAINNSGTIAGAQEGLEEEITIVVAARAIALAKFRGHQIETESPLRARERAAVHADHAHDFKRQAAHRHHGAEGDTA